MATNHNKLPLQTSNKANIIQTTTNPKTKTVEETYQKRSPREHILLRPDTYIGSNVKNKQTLWVYENNKMVYREINYVPGLYKIFDEILVNAADNKQRDPSMDLLQVNIDVENNCISVFNNGEGIPVAMHKNENVYVPEMIFGQLLTSSNYDDRAKKTTGGRNGFGAKLTNIFSTEFVVETADGKRQMKYKQVFSNNMNKRSDPIITKCNENESWTKVSFKPDLAKFKMEHLDDDVVALMKRRVVDLAGCLGPTVKVELNGQQVPVRSFYEYVHLYLQTQSVSIPRFPEYLDARWEIYVFVREGRFEQVSFVNGIATMKGGTHVNHITDQIVDYVLDRVYTENPKAEVRPHFVKNHLWVFVNALIDNPAFDSQTKMTLTTREADFGSDCILPEDFLDEVCDAGIVESILSWAKYKLQKNKKKADQEKRRRLTGIPKLEDANEAGGDDSDKCTLILTEGDSAKALAMAGISAVGRNHYGVFPLRGKLLNVREATQTQIIDNSEIQNIQKILGLEPGKKYDSIESLRYGHLMIMTDQDHDGSHIKGLLINFVHALWPSLLKIPSFLVEFITPIVKATNKYGAVLSFYSMPEYQSWKESLGGNTTGWSIKYYKGLGTSTSKEGKEYFQELEKHRKEFVWVDERDSDAIELAFSKNKIEGRKKWLLEFKAGTYLDQKEKCIPYRDFVNKELIQFSMADLQRSIPSMVDGFKPGQRKILFCSFNRNLIREAKVAQFSGYVSEHSAYHHGEQSLANTIVGMAQDYVGSNNINLLQPNGQFGTRHQGGKDHASARYIYTCLSPITRYLFPKSDDILLNYLNEEGQSIEPTWYMPIVPMVLVNGTEGIGTGWSTYVPNYNPFDIIANIRHLLDGEPMEPMHPWYRGFKGSIEKKEVKEAGASYNVNGIIKEVNKKTVRITELPVRKSTEDYKTFLDSIVSNNGRNREQFIKSYKEHNDDKTVDFEINLSEKNLSMAKEEGLMNKFRLTSTISTTNMHLFDHKGVLRKYDMPEQILEEFFGLRLEYYDKRKKALLRILESELLKLENKVKFIRGVVEGDIVVVNRKRADLLFELKQQNFSPFGRNATVSEESIQRPGENEYEYLLSMPIGALTLEKVQELCAEQEKLRNEVDDLQNATPKSLWLKDLDALEKELNRQPEYKAMADDARMGSGGREMAGKGFEVVNDAVRKPKRRYTKKKGNVESVAEKNETSKPSSEETGKNSEMLKAKDKKGRKEARRTKSALDETKDKEVEARNNIGSQEAPPAKSASVDTKDKEVEALKAEDKPNSNDSLDQPAEMLKSQNSSSSPTYAAEKKTGDLIETPMDDNRSGGAVLQSNSIMIEISDTEEHCKDDEVCVIREERTDKTDGDQEIEVQIISALEWAINGSGNHASTNETQTTMLTRKRAKEIKQQQALLSQEKAIDVTKAAGNSFLSPEKKVRKISPSPFRKNGYSLGLCNNGDYGNSLSTK